MAMEVERTHEYASKGVAGAGLGTGIAGLSLGVINTVGGLALNAMNNKKSSAASTVEAVVPAMAGVMAASVAGSAGRSTGYCNEDHLVNRYEAGQAARIAELETQIKLRDANTYTDSKMLEMYQYIDGRLRGVEGQIAQQAVYNATNTAALNCMQGQINQLLGLTKIVVPNSSVCPGWGAATVTVSTGTTTT